MAKIEDLISHISDERLRKALADDVRELKKTKNFGLVFEEHIPETVRLPGLLAVELPHNERVALTERLQTRGEAWPVVVLAGWLTPAAACRSRGRADDGRLCIRMSHKGCCAPSSEGPLLPE